MSWRASGGIKRWAADDWFSKTVREMANHECEHCHKPATDCAHIVGRADFTVRWCLDNAVALCRYCHDQFGQNPVDFIEWLDSQYPGRRDRIQVRRRGSLKNTPDNRKLISNHYRAEYRALVADSEYIPRSWN